MKRVLSIAGSDCSGGAGIQADLKTFSAHGVFGMSVIVSVVAENTSRVIDIQDVAPDMIEKQIDAIFEDIGTDAVKIGMLSGPSCMEAVSGRLRRYKPRNVVIDPVMYAKNGCPLMDPAAIDTLIKEIIPFADVLTPNIPEAEEISGRKIEGIDDMERAAKLIYGLGAKSVIVKGGHAAGDAVDVLYDGKGYSRFSAGRIDTKKHPRYGLYLFLRHRFESCARHGLNLRRFPCKTLCDDGDRAFSADRKRLRPDKSFLRALQKRPAHAERPA